MHAYEVRPITLVKPMTIQVEYGNITLQAGTRVDFISRNGELDRPPT